MRLDKISVCYFPTTVVLVDDKKSFLDELRMSLNKISCKTFSSPKKFMEFINHVYKSDAFVNRCLNYDENSDLDSVFSNVNFRSIHQEIYNRKRFTQISILVIDYAMPQLNGLQCCEQIQDPYIYKILLTGEADTDTAIHAFNRGIINKFVQKNEANLNEVIRKAIQQMQMKYFMDISKKLYGTDTSQISQRLSDPVFIDFFTKLCEQEEIVEYYLLDKYGSFLMLDIEANPKWFIVKTQNDLDEILELASMSDAPKDILDELRKRKKIPYFYSDEDLKIPPTKWHKYMHSAKKLAGNENYYYAIISDSKLYPLDHKKILSYKQYLEKDAI